MTPPPCFPEIRLSPTPNGDKQPPRFKDDAANDVEWFPNEPSSPRYDPAPPLRLEIRGVTAQKPTKPPQSPSKTAQNAFWSAAVIHRNAIAAKLRDAGQLQLASKLELCHTQTVVAVCSDCGKASRFQNRCDLFFCPQCAARLQREREDQVRWWTVEIPQPKHVVLTVKNTPTISKATVKRLKKWLGSLRRSKFCNNWLGGFYRLECTNEGNGWHLHIHLLVDARWIDQFALSEKWNKITGGNGRIVKVLDCREQSYLHEVTKYVVKGHQMAAWQPSEILQFINAFTGVRTFGVFGSLYGKRTEFAEWIASTKGEKPRCPCGSDRCKFYSETEWEIAQLQLTPTTSPRPPSPVQPLELAFADRPCWPD